MPHALHFLVLALAGWVTRHQENRIDYLREENRVLREHLGPRPLRLTDAQRRRLAVRGQKHGRRILSQEAGIVTPDTILRWYRRLIAQQYDGCARRCRGWFCQLAGRRPDRRPRSELGQLLTKHTLPRSTRRTLGCGARGDGRLVGGAGRRGRDSGRRRGPTRSVEGARSI